MTSGRRPPLVAQTAVKQASVGETRQWHTESTCELSYPTNKASRKN